MGLPTRGFSILILLLCLGVFLEHMGNRLSGMNILVTGSGRGFGQSMAVAFASEGAHVISTSRTWSELKNT